MEKIEKKINEITFKNMITFIACRYLSYLRLKYLATGLDDILRQALISPFPNYLTPLFQSEALSSTIYMKMALISM